MVGTPVWQGRIEVAHTVPRELRAEQAYSIDRLDLGDLAPPCLMLLGSESPSWARASTEAFSGAIGAAEVHSLEGHGHGALVSGPELLASEIVGLAR
jgi:pimeloyl-ACP methyl ester carboxylesterase